MKNNGFRLSPTGRLAVSVAIIMIFSSNGFANGITPGGDPSHQPGVTNAKNGAVVINIAAPSESGLSHNQYEDFNVSKDGAVFNNSLTDGKSQLAGKLSANNNLHGRAAQIILNEVISRNPSLLLGKQEVFGVAADYVLANPNGITCNGCGFINTNQLSLVVGNPLVDKGILKGFNTFEGKNSLKIGERGLVHNAIINLIAPQINSLGKISTSQDLNIITGQNKISADGQLLDTKKSAVGLLDSYYLGSMQAGRIRLLSTDKGSGVNLQGEMAAGGGINIESKGELKLEGARLKGGDLELKGDTILSQGALGEVSFKDEKSERYIMSGNSTRKERKLQSVAHTRLEGKNIILNAKKDNKIMATDIYGDNINLTGENLKLEGQQYNQHTEDNEEQWKFLWKDSKTNTYDKIQQDGNHIQASGNIKLTATDEDIKIQGSQIDAGNNILLSAKRDVVIDNLIENEKTSNQEYIRFDSGKLTTGNKEKSYSIQKNIRSELNAGSDLGIEANGNVELIGTKAHSGNNLIIKAGKQARILSKSFDNNKATDANNLTYWGGIAGGKNKNNYTEDKQNQSSDITANGHILLGGDDGIRITGSNIKAGEGAYFKTINGDLIIDNAVNYHQNNIDERNGTVFNITKDSNKEKEYKETALQSQVISDADLKLLSGKDIEVVDSLIKSANNLNIDALGDVKISSYGEKYDQQKIKSFLKVGFIFKPSDKKDSGKIFDVGPVINYTSDSQKQGKITQKSSEISGGNISINANKDVTIVGSDIETKNGDAHISADNISFLAADNEISKKQSHSSTGVGLVFSLSKGGISAAIGTKYGNINNSQQQKIARVSKTNIAGNLKLTARDKLEQQGTQHNVAGNYDVGANRIENRAAVNSITTSSGNLTAGGVVGISFNMKNSSPGVYLDIAAKGSNHIQNSNVSNDNVTSIKANNINVNARGDVYDQGTQYHATGGDIELKANNHISETAFNHKEINVFDTSGNAGLQVGFDIMSQEIVAKATGKGGSSWSSKSRADAIVSDFKAKKNINIQTKHDARYQGVSFDTENGKTTINAGDNISFNQANNINKVSNKNYSVGTGIQVGFNVTTGVVDSGAIIAGAQYATSDENTIIAKNSNVKGVQGVSLTAGNNLSLQGTNVSGNQIDLTAKQGEIAITSAQDSVKKNGLQIGGEGGVSAAINGSKLNQLGVKVYGEFGKEYANAVTNYNSQIIGETVTLNSGKDTTLRGANIIADRMNGKIGGHLNIENAKNINNRQLIDVGAGFNFNGSNILNNNQPANFWGILAKVKDVLTGIKPRFKFNYDKYDHTDLVSQSGISDVSSIDLNVAGKNYRIGKRNDGNKQPINFNTQAKINHSMTACSKGEKESAEIPCYPVQIIADIQSYDEKAGVLQGK
ncbi:hemagglutinin repeat-containing protein [Xenorhabdus sp. Flor]|uniref:hemagglutinin repeat-containing protein n=1 Tax=Xenorhabdus cabanillasii TaxID=351673 RepID=UPI0019B15E54|nr:hemagglutinin repeat-containing protein [Xenorhabdus sp. Flor]MBD2814192.1 hemagglutinin repeat-containing protein [Xenorhabdus sp. Flor]